MRMVRQLLECVPRICEELDDLESPEAKEILNEVSNSDIPGVWINEARAMVIEEGTV